MGKLSYLESARGSNFVINLLSTFSESESYDSESDFNSVFMNLDIFIFFTLYLIKQTEGEISSNDVRGILLNTCYLSGQPPPQKLKLSKSNVKFMKNRVEGPVPGI